MTNNETPANKIDRLAAQDAYWYAECCAANGSGETFQAGKLRGTDWIGTLAKAWSMSLDAAKRANINLSGLSLRNGTIAERGKALRLRVKEESARQGIVAECGETIQAMSSDSGDTARFIAASYGIADLVPADVLGPVPAAEEPAPDSSRTMCGLPLYEGGPCCARAPKHAPPCSSEGEPEEEPRIVTRGGVKVFAGEPATGASLEDYPEDVSVTLEWIARLPEVGAEIREYAVTEAELVEQINARIGRLARLRGQAKEEVSRLWTAEEIAAAKLA